MRVIVAVAARLMAALRQKPCQARVMLNSRNETIAQPPRWYPPPTSSRMTRPSSRATTRLRRAVTMSASWVAMSTVTPELVDAQEELEDLPADQRVQVAGRLVGDDDPRVVDERAGDRGPLLLAAGQLLGVLLGLLGRGPTSASTRSTAGLIRRAGVPVTSSANATFSEPSWSAGA